MYTPYRVVLCCSVLQLYMYYPLPAAVHVLPPAHSCKCITPCLQLYMYYALPTAVHRAVVGTWSGARRVPLCGVCRQ